MESSTLIDLIVTTRIDLVSTTGVFPLGPSDHDFIYATLRLKNKRPRPRVIKVRDFKKMDSERFKSDIEYAPFQVAFIFDDTDDVLWAWQSLFDDICNTHVPWKEVKIKSQAPAWMANEIRVKMNRRVKLLKLAVATKCPIQWSEYKCARNDVTRSIRLAKASYFSNLFMEVKSSSAYWNLLNKLRRDGGSLALTDEDKANVINSFFATVDDKLSNLLPPPLTSQSTGHRREVPSLSRATINQKLIT